MDTKSTTVSAVDQLFRFTFSQIVIKRIIFRFVSKLNNPSNLRLSSRKYEEINDLKWVIENKHFGLLRDKLKRNEYLHCYPQYLKIIMYIKDLELFKLCFQKYNLYFPLNCQYPQTTRMAAEANNYTVLCYLLECGYKACPQTYEYAIRRGNHDMVILLTPLLMNNDQLSSKLVITDSILDYAIESAKIDIIKSVLDYAYSDPSRRKIKEANSMKRVVKALYTGKVEVLKLIRDKYPFEYTDLDGFQFFLGSASSLEMFTYVYNTYGTVLLAKKEPWIFYEMMERVCTECARNCDIDIIKFIFENKLIRVEQNVSKALIILRYGHIELFKWIQANYIADNATFSFQLQKTYISDVRGSLMDIEKVQFLNNLGLTISYVCLLQACRVDPEVFKFLFLQIADGILIDQHISMLIYESIKYDNAEVLEFLKTKGVGLIHIDIRQDSWEKSGSSDKSLEVFKFIFKDNPPSDMHYHSLLSALNKAAISGSINTFKYLYTIKRSLNKDMSIDDYPLYESAALYGQLQILEYLHEQKAPFQRCNAMTLAAQTNRLDIIDYLCEQGHQCTSSVIEAASFYGHLSIIQYLSKTVKNFADLCTDFALFNAVRESREPVVRFFLDNEHHQQQFKNHFNHSSDLLLALGLCNMAIFELVYKYKWPKKPDYSITMSNAICNGYIEVVMFLFQKNITITWEMVESAVKKKNSWILEYLVQVLDMQPFRNQLKTSYDAEKNTHPNDPFIQYMNEYTTRCVKKKSIFSFFKK